MEGLPSDDNLSENNKKAIEVLTDAGIRFSVFNLLIDSHLKEFLNANYTAEGPLFFAAKTFVGNLATITELAKKQELL